MLGKIESRLNYFLSNYPNFKKIIKRCYQAVNYLLSDKQKVEGNVIRITPNDEYEYFYGYYGISPWDSSDRYLLAHRVKDTLEAPAPNEPAEIVLIDTESNNYIDILASTKTWNIQQGSMAQWLGPTYRDNIIYNDFIDGQFCSIILNVNTKVKKKLAKPIYTVSPDGRFALTLDFSRLHRLRPGYGYSNLQDSTEGQSNPTGTCIWRIDLEDNRVENVLTYEDLIKFENRSEMSGAVHKVNHLMINPSGTRFMFLHRWTKNNRKFSRLLTCNLDGSNLFNLLDDDMVSHSFWKSDTEIVTFARKANHGNAYFLLKDMTTKYETIWENLKIDGHPSYSPNGLYAVTDTYPDRKRNSRIYLIKQQKEKVIAKVFVPFKYDNQFRCDLHPRWNHNSDKVCFDSVHEGKRQIYFINLGEEGSIK